MKVYAFVPAKGTSERVENKNMRYLDGERLYIRALKTLLNCKEVDQVFLDTESTEMFEKADYLPIKFMKRDPALASNKTDGHQMFVNEVKSFPDADIYVQLLCTSPFISAETIDNAIRQLKVNSNYDSAVLMKKEKCYFWKDNRPLYDIEHIPNSKDLPDTIFESMGLYICRKETALSLNRRYGDSPLLIYANNEEAVDVNTPQDLHFAELYAKGKRAKDNQTLGLVKHFLSSAALSDLLDDFQVEKGVKCGAVIPGWKMNLPHVKLLGRANTLKLRKLEEGEDFRGIYDALDSYDGIAKNDIICIENEVNEFAYFGDLNARLALRSGAAAAIVDGATRDLNETIALNFPVIARGYNPKDVRRRATVDFINKPIHIGGELVTPGDLVFVDECAVVVIYQEFEKEIIDRVIKTYNNEEAISTDILNLKNVRDITKKRGAF